MRQVACTRDIPASWIWSKTIGCFHIVADSRENLVIGVAVRFDSDYPLDAITRGAGEHQRGFELGICKQ